ncbi:MAG: ribonuclease HII [Gammaproteobacteria bacterium]
MSIINLRTKLIAGIDEAGRGPLAGPVVAGSVILDANTPIEELADSKKLTIKKRLHLCDEIKSKAYAWGIGLATANEIDEINIHRATLLAMHRAYKAMKVDASHVYIDGLHCPNLEVPSTAVVKGDQLIAEISAASILAKVTRDTEMEEHHKELPVYGFNQHKGYPTAKHIAALQEHGPCKLHRKSYKPVKDVLAALNTI